TRAAPPGNRGETVPENESGNFTSESNGVGAGAAERPASPDRRLSRRQLLQSAGVVAGVGAAAAAGLTLRQARPAAAARGKSGGRTGTIADLKHIVIVMQENRSFDHILGTVAMPGVRGFGDKQLLTWQNGRTNYYEPNSRAEGYLLPYRADSTKYNGQNTSS